MIFEEIVLHNFGPYKGRHSLSLTPPSQKKPVVLIGGLNGGGKTTLLDAIHLSLYGKRARCSNRGNLGYEDYLRQSIHHQVGAGEGAALEIQFRQRAEGVERSWRVHRSWSAVADGVTERVEVIRDNTFDRILTESWPEAVEEFIPVEISSLFFFDGEKIEGFADLENSTQLLSKAVHSLLGLNLVDRLATDLAALERRKQTAMKAETDRKQIEAAEAEVIRLEQQHAELVAQRGAARNNVERRQYDLRRIEERFRHEGGDLFERREQLEVERKNISQQLQSVEEESRDLAESAAPLLLVSNLLHAVDQQNRQEEDAARSEAVGQILIERDDWLLDRLQSLRASGKLLDTVKSLLLEDRKQRITAISNNCYLNLTDSGRNNLRTLNAIVLPDVRQRAIRLLEQADDLRRALEEADRRLAAVPAESAISSIIEERRRAQIAVEESQAQVRMLDKQLEQVSWELEQKQAAHAALIEKSVEARFEQEDVARIIVHSQKVRKTLDVFRASVVDRHVSRIAQLVLDSFQQLLRKRSLISDLRIDPQSFALELRGMDGKVLPPDRLSAGERQLLAVSMLWGLARASGRPLPAVIDTPLGRLDAEHRSNLIERYFPNASHQVLLLSTDEEIDEKYYEKLKPWVGRSYLLEFNDSIGATQIRPGYFWQ